MPPKNVDTRLSNILQRFNELSAQKDEIKKLIEAERKKAIEQILAINGLVVDGKVKLVKFGTIGFLERIHLQKMKDGSLAPRFIILKEVDGKPSCEELYVPLTTGIDDVHPVKAT